MLPRASRASSRNAIAANASKRRRAKHVHADGAGSVSLRERAPEDVYQSDLDQAVTREFCERCGTHLTTRRPDLPLVISEGRDHRRPKHFWLASDGDPHARQAPFHLIPEGVPTFERDPPR
jgi:hypothetical protein